MSAVGLDIYMKILFIISSGNFSIIIKIIFNL
jgi:hypothetical protein